MEARKAVIALGRMVDRLLGKSNTETEKSNTGNVQTGPRGGRYYLDDAGNKVYIGEGQSAPQPSKLTPAQGAGMGMSMRRAPTPQERQRAEDKSRAITNIGEKVLGVDLAKRGTVEVGTPRCRQAMLTAFMLGASTEGQKFDMDKAEAAMNRAAQAHGAASKISTMNARETLAYMYDAGRDETPKTGYVADALAKLPAEKPKTEPEGETKKTLHVDEIGPGRRVMYFADDEANKGPKNMQTGPQDGDSPAASPETRKSISVADYVEKARKEKLKGGRADGRKVSDFDPEQLAAGMKVEREHTTNEDEAREIAMDHLSESPDYYRELASMENKLEDGQSEAATELKAAAVAAFTAWTDQMAGKKAADAPTWTKPASTKETAWQFVQRAAVELLKTDAGKKIEAEYGSGREFVDYLALILKKAGIGTGHEPEAQKGGKDVKLTGPEALEFVLWEIQRSAVRWCAWKRGESEEGGPCRCYEADEAERVRKDTERRANDTPDKAAKRTADSSIGDISWGSDMKVIAMREAGGLPAYQALLVKTFLDTVAVEHTAKPIPGLEKPSASTEPDQGQDTSVVEFPDQV